MLFELIADASARRTLAESTILGHQVLPADQYERAVAYVGEHADFTAYHVLFAIREASEALYQSIPRAVRASILCSTLAELTYLNDWGHLTVNPSEGLPARALVELGPAALDCLESQLRDSRPAPFFGSADATLASQYRRNDFAYRAAAEILGEKPAFAATPEARDSAIARLLARLKK